MKETWLWFKAQCLRLFPERQLFLRSNNQVRYLTIPTEVQIVATVGAFIALIWLLIATLQVYLQSNSIQEREAVIASINDDYRSLSSDFSALEKEIARRTQLIEERQSVLDSVLQDISPNPDSLSKQLDSPTEGTADSETPERSASSRDQRTHLVARLEHIVAQQNAQALAITDLFKTRQDHIEKAMAPTSIDLGQMMTVNASALGGPYLPEVTVPSVFTPKDYQPLDEMISAHASYASARDMLGNIPVAAPAKDYYISSSFGRRIDPIKKTPSRHPGLDIAAWKGSPVLSTASGMVVFAGWNGPYGNMVDIDHGNGYKTRYGHMSKLRVKKGDVIDLGHHIGDVGDTGRTTGIHIHYEIWFNGRLVNPILFLKAKDNVRKIQDRFAVRETEGFGTNSGAEDEE